MQAIRRHLIGLSTLIVAVQTWIVTIGVASCCLASAPHGADMPDVCPMVHEQGETCPMHAQQSPASHHDQSMTDAVPDACRIGCAPGTRHGLLQNTGGPRQEPVTITAEFVSTSLDVDLAARVLDPILPVFSPPPRS